MWVWLEGVAEGVVQGVPGWCLIGEWGGGCRPQGVACVAYRTRVSLVVFDCGFGWEVLCLAMLGVFLVGCELGCC